MKDNYQYTNSLSLETSPYLLQHAHNPVEWYPWCEKAFEIAKKENKLVLISIGYASCHWCHVMERQSFENKAIADIMNKNYICIKVDREERPDVDQVYMSAVQLLTGSGGWPLNCFTLPDGSPIYGGTYFQPEQWLQILQGLAITFKTDPDRINSAAKEISAGIKSHEIIDTKHSVINFTTEEEKQMFDAWKPHFDEKWGGNQHAPKFPIPCSFIFLLNYAQLSGNSEALKHVNLTLIKIAQGGIYDHVGGGFSRYSVDEAWKIPHFEKMLYDNGQLVSLYSHAFKLTKKQIYKHATTQTLEFIEREMSSHEGAFYSSFDADSEGVEGKFYVWKLSEIDQLLENDANWFCEYFNVTKNGNWEKNNILWITNAESVKLKYGFNEATLAQKLNTCINKLFTYRLNRIHPKLDDKVLTSWNALMGIGYIDAYEAIEEQRYLNKAITNAKFIQNNMLQKEGNLHRNYKNGASNINGFLDDYAFTIQLFTKLYQATFDENWLSLSEKLTHYTLAHFYDPKSGMFFYTSDIDKELIARKMEVSDNVIPSSNSTMANNLFDLGTLLSLNDWKEKARQMLANVMPNVKQNVSYYGNWGILHQKFSHPFYEVVFVGKKALELQKEFVTFNFPNTVIAGQQIKTNSKLQLLKNRGVANETLIYVCSNNTCKLPVKSVNEVQQLMQ